ncbi:peptide chain release factor N(5)-glutamine methyltransferase, partial [Prochlorococcus sp. AH-736-N17]
MLCISVEEFLFWKKKQLSKGGDQESFAVLLDCIGGISTKDLYLVNINPERNLHLKKNLEFLESVWDDHLLKSCPIQYLCGITFWRDLKLKVTNKVLIPRPETELIVDIVFNIFQNKSAKLYFADLGTGSGAISIALALTYPFSEGVATDIDQDALEIATKNFVNSSQQSNLKFYCGNWWTPLESFKGKLDLAISNPPYIPRDTYEKLPKEV